ncbi:MULTISPECIES: respiratory nitrate reductase subunit gamma [unclassified Actinobaculum]|uniref:respiratory nitrate reductase subunit gamma n=1 Tax=unclassified Actinobaculum TaxID=2609299 RepID=UPI000D525D97|nr:MULTISPECIES: respiratory nitrate reductase subunit gamma [unclassified Actinobaculum]AWE41780.1 respiratory nitrate reductase subunit gamma [Actinobaculum sp. 313]RTE50302.1 respiratory nitrate reductase subunit gamma [Actinobaculum sp. 352]
MNALDLFLWAIFPYMCAVLFVAGLVWRWRTDQFGWTARSSQLHESKLLRLGSPLFHFGIIFVLLGHLMGLIIPKSWTNALGISEHAYHVLATVGGSAAGLATILGLVLLIIRRIRYPGVRRATTRNDKIMYVLLGMPILLGAFATVQNQIFGAPGGYDYRETISVWLRSLFVFQPKVELLAGVPLSFKLHIVAGLLLIAMVPFTRLVHSVTPPVGYVTRPYVVYRSRRADVATSATAKGWAPLNGVQPRDQGRHDAHAQGA